MGRKAKLATEKRLAAEKRAATARATQVPPAKLDISHSVEGMKVICHELTQAVDPESSVLDDLIKEADRLVSCLAVMVPKTFNFSLSGASSRSCKYVLNTLMQTFQIKRLAHAVKEGTLDNLITELLLWLLDERVSLMDDGSQLLKALNALMLKILDNAERTSSFVVLINLLGPLDPSRWPSPTTPESLVVKNQKFSDLVVKCLIKLTKVLQSTIYEVDLDRILQSVHIYLHELGMDEIRRRAGADDKPLRMVKTVLHELVKLRGTAIKGHLSMVPRDAEAQPIILAYIELSLQLRDWLDLSLNHAVPSSLLILSRAFTLSGRMKPEEAVVATLSSLPDEGVDTVGTVLPSEDSVSERRRKLEFLEMQEELIKVDAMLQELEKEIDDVDAQIGNRWQLLDRDHDGKVTPEEVAAVAAYLKDTTIGKEGVQELISNLSRDKEGKIRVEDIVKLGSQSDENNEDQEDESRQ